MSGVKVFQGAFRYLTDVVRKTVNSLNKERLLRVFEILINARNNRSNIIVDGQGRSQQSLLLAEDCLEHNGFPIIFPTSNANLRPWKKGDVLIINTGSGSGSPIKHAQAAKKDGLAIIGMSYNSKLLEEFPNILILEPSKNSNKLFAPLGTEFELSSAVIGVCLSYAVASTPEESFNEFQKSTKKVLDLFDYTYTYLEEELESLMSFISLVTEYLPAENQNKIYFRGVGRDAIINRVAAIRYGHLHKNPNIDLQVIYEGHWDLRKAGDLAIITSGSGATAQTLNYGMQAFISGMRVFGITSFRNSDMGKFASRVDGCLVLPGREKMMSGYNMASHERETYLPEFELNSYLTLDCLLAQIAANFEISEEDMRASHRQKVLE